MKKLAIKIAYYVLAWAPLQLAWNAILGWSDDQLAAWFGITGPTVSQVYKALVEFGPSLLSAALAFYLYHLWWSRQADASAAPVAQLTEQERREELHGQASANKERSVYLTAYETIHYLADESQWGANTDSYVSPDGLQKERLVRGAGRVSGQSSRGQNYSLWRITANWTA